MGIGIGLAGALVLGGGTCDEGDTTPPAIVSTVPADAAAVSLTTTISATFSEAMDAATINSGTFRLRAGTIDVAGAVTLDAATNTAVFAPADLLYGGVEYTATVTAGVADTAGNHLAADYPWSFTTAIVWEHVGDQVSPPGAESEDPTMLLPAGTPAVGYRHGSFATHLVLWDGTAWGAPQPDPSGGETNGSIYGTPSFCAQGTTVQLAYSHAGDATASDDTFYDRVFAYSWTGTTGWEARNGGDELSVVWDPTLGGANAWEPAIACPDAGDPFVAWVEGDVAPDPDREDAAWVSEVGTASAVRSEALSRNDDAGGYTTAVRTVGLTVDDAGNAYVAQWESDDADQDRTDLYVTRWDGTDFTPLGGAVTDDYDYNNLCVPSLEIVGTEVWIAYSRANPDDYTKEIFVARWTGSAWETVGGGPVTAMTPTEHFDAANPDLALVDGEPWVAWEETDQDSGTYIFVARWDAVAGEWVLEGERLNVDPARTAHDPSLAWSESDDVVYVAFEEFTDGWPHIFVKRRLLLPGG
ncbi:MAG: Ig-like domain-containing protein [Deltaproteobacteria bacterium]|nr:Ig-like domain-containing protein [Deltaproteobacteria bacterium]